MLRRPPAVPLVTACLCTGRALAQDKQLLAKLPGPSDAELGVAGRQSHCGWRRRL